MSEGTESTFKVGDVVDEKWVILSFIDKGGMGEVYRAHQLNLDRDVAIKIISPVFLDELSDNEYEAEACVERFHREVKAMAQMHHPNILQIFDCGSATITKNDKDTHIEYLVMEYVPGGTLRSTMSPQGFHPEEDRTKDWLLDYFLPLLDGVIALHELGVVHRDLKPENVLMDGKTPKITDFGLARCRRLAPFTQSMDMKGTPPYMSPEHFLDLKRTDERADVYSLGKIIYEAVCGKISSDQMPFKKASLPIADTPFFEHLRRVIENATEEDRHVRTASVQVMKQEIEDTVKTIGATHALPHRTPLQRATLWRVHIRAAVMIVLLGAGLSIGLLFFHGEMKAPDTSSPEKLFGSILPSQILSDADPPSKLRGNDEDVLLRIPAGTLMLPREAGANEAKEIKVDSFYLDEMPVTNYQYVKFLNSVLPRLKVENEVVQGDGHVWLLLGEVMPDYEPIVYRGGRFDVQNAAHASCPVLRVTGYGASEYVRFYGKRLPTAAEWLYAAQKGGETSDAPTAAESAPSHSMHVDGASAQTSSSDRPSSSSNGSAHPMMPSPVITLKPNLLGVRGMDGWMGEWVQSGLNGTQSTKSSNPAYMVIGGAMAKTEGRTALPGFVPRQPWEASAEVGFRCAMSFPKDSTAGAS